MRGVEWTAEQCIGDSATLAKAQCAAWIELYDSTGGPTWTQGAGSRLDPCSREACSRAPVRELLSIRLRATHLVGTLPRSLGALTALRRLFVDGNSLHGTLPTELGALSQLVGFGVAANHFTGPLPAGLPWAALNYTDANDDCGLYWNAPPTYPRSNAFDCPLPAGALAVCQQRVDIARWVPVNETSVCAPLPPRPAPGGDGGEGASHRATLFVVVGCVLAAALLLGGRRSAKRRQQDQERRHTDLSTPFLDGGHSNAPMAAATNPMHHPVAGAAATAIAVPVAQAGSPDDPPQRFAGSELQLGRAAHAAMGAQMWSLLGVDEQSRECTPPGGRWIRDNAVMAITAEFRNAKDRQPTSCNQDSGFTTSMDFFEYVFFGQAKEQRMASGKVRDKGHSGMRLKDFAADPRAQFVLDEAHVLALRLYTSNAYYHVNDPLRELTTQHDGTVGSAVPSAAPLVAPSGRGRHPLGAAAKGVLRPEHSGDSSLRAGRRSFRSATERREHSGDSSAQAGRRSGASLSFRCASLGGSGLPLLLAPDQGRSSFLDAPRSSNGSVLVAREPHPFAATTFFVQEAIKRLGSDDGRGAGAARTYYRGMRSMATHGPAWERFLEDGGTEMAVLSVTTDRDVAVEFASGIGGGGGGGVGTEGGDGLLFEIVVKDTIGCAVDISWLSLFPEEKELLFPPCTYLMVNKDAPNGGVTRTHGQLTVVQVTPHFR